MFVRDQIWNEEAGAYDVVLTEIPDPPVIPDVPEEISMAQCCQWLLAQPSKVGAPSLLNDVEVVIATMDRSAQVDWQRRQTVRRDFYLVQQLKDGLGFTDSDLDDMFIAANQL